MAVLTVLVVDDEPGIRSGVSRILNNFHVNYPFMDEDYTFQVLEAAIGEAAVVDERGDALARRELAGLVLFVDARLAAGEHGFRLHVGEALDRIAGAHRCGVL